ncbi:hypothetical protein ACIA5G_39300 [Amycolatopsis sp. NPDC051758]|uniref:hypothetical protein n=1 Tax=Amycolatopsis sp. NPDC051758 TaxID=3363935 RepID=UPI0037939C94
MNRVCGWEVWEAEGLKTIETPALAPGQCRNLPFTRTAANRTGTAHILWGGRNCTGREYPLLVGAYASAAAGALSISTY